MNIGIACDDWKLSTFKTQLEKKGYTFEVLPGLTKETKLIKVDTDEPAGLHAVVCKADNICRSMSHET